MTYKEFVELAKNPPADTRPSVFMLKIFRYSQYRKAEYPEFCIDVNRLLFTSYSEAENHMHSVLNDEHLYCFQILQLPLGVVLERRVEYSRLWLFDRHGILIDRSYASSIYADSDNLAYPVFRGRPEDMMRFKPGDIIEYLCRDSSVKIGVVLYQPCSYDMIWQRIEKRNRASEVSNEFYWLDFSDDIYIVVDENYERWGYDRNVPCTSAMPLSLPLPDDMRKHLIDKYEWAAQGN